MPRHFRLIGSAAQELALAEAGHAGFEEGRAGLAHGQLDGGGALALLADAESLDNSGEFYGLVRAIREMINFVTST